MADTTTTIRVLSRQCCKGARHVQWQRTIIALKRYRFSALAFYLLYRDP